MENEKQQIKTEKTKKGENMKRTGKGLIYRQVLLGVLFLILSINIYSEKITDYVNKKDVQNVNKIFIYKERNDKKQGNSQGRIVKNGNDEKEKENEIQKTNEKKEAPKEMIPVINEKIGELELEYRDVKEISEKLDGINGFKIIGIDNKIILSGDEKKIEDVKGIIKSLDNPREQVIIRGRIIDTSSNLFERLGLDWNLSTENQSPEKSSLIGKFLNGEISIGSILSNGGMFLGIDFNLLRETGDIKIEAMPTLLIMENEEGELRVTEEVIIGEKKTTKNNEDYTEPVFSEAGIVFKISPEIKRQKNEKKILLKMDTEISNFKLTSNYSNTSGAKQKNQTKTIITLNNGGSTFIGGLKQNVNKETIRKVPVLSSIPIIGPLFKYKRKNNEIRDIYIEIEAIIQEIKQNY